MRKIDWTNRFKRDYKREQKGYHRSELDTNLTAILKLLVIDKPLPQKM